MIKQRTFEELIVEMKRCYSNILKNDVFKKKDIFFIQEEELNKKCVSDELVVFTVKKEKLLNINQFQELYVKYCEESRNELKLVLITIKPKILIAIEISKVKNNPNGLVNITFPIAIPNKKYNVIFLD